MRPDDLRALGTESPTSEEASDQYLITSLGRGEAPHSIDGLDVLRALVSVHWPRLCAGARAGRIAGALSRHRIPALGKAATRAFGC